jgi:polyhydroxybutyrate depolymerase
MGKGVWVVLVLIIIVLFGIFRIVNLKNVDNNNNTDIILVDNNTDITPVNNLVNDKTFSLMQDGIERYYKVHFPSSYDGSKSMPLVIYVHGGGGNLESAYVDDIDKYSNEDEFILAIPQGSYSDKENSYSWNGGSWSGGACCGNADDVGFISKMIDKIEADYNIDETKVYAMGISNGGLFTNRLACELSDKIAAIATVAPAGVPLNCNPQRKVSVMDIHGTGDRCNPFSGGTPDFSVCANVDYQRMSAQETVDKWIEVNGCSGQSNPVYSNGKAECVIYSCDNSEVEFCKVEDMGHTWPSGSQYLPALMIGRVSNDISTDQIWNFFEKNSL